MKDILLLHYCKCRIMCWWNLINDEDIKIPQPLLPEFFTVLFLFAPLQVTQLYEGAMLNSRNSPLRTEIAVHIRCCSGFLV